MKAQQAANFLGETRRANTDMSSLEDMKEITKRPIFGLRQSLQFIDPRGVRLLSRKGTDISNRVKISGKFHLSV